MTPDEITGWFAGRIPDGWFAGPLEVTQDREEILVVGELPVPGLDDDASDSARRASVRSRIEAFREESRGQRVEIARHAEAMLGRKVSWGARCGDTTMIFTHLTVPAMTRLRLHERLVLDTLVDSGVARSRSEALAWCVRLVGKHEGDWLEQLRRALVHVEAVRDEGPL